MRFWARFVAPAGMEVPMLVEFKDVEKSYGKGDGMVDVLKGVE